MTGAARLAHLAPAAATVGGRVLAVGMGTVRKATSLGLPEGLPDIDGPAWRFPFEGPGVDVLFSAAGTGRLTRNLLSPHRSGRR